MSNSIRIRKPCLFIALLIIASFLVSSVCTAADKGKSYKPDEKSRGQRSEKYRPADSNTKSGDVKKDSNYQPGQINRSDSGRNTSYKPGTPINSNDPKTYKPSTVENRNGNNIYRPGTVDNRNGSNTYKPGTVNNRNSSNIHKPGTIDNRNGNNTYRPSTVDNRNSSNTHKPGTVYNRNGSNIYKPGNVDNHNGSNTYKPGTVDNRNDSKTYKPRTDNNKSVPNQYDPKHHKGNTNHKPGSITISVPKSYKPPTYNSGRYYYSKGKTYKPYRYGYWTFDYYSDFSKKSCYYYYGFLPYIQIVRIYEIPRPTRHYYGSTYITYDKLLLERALSDIKESWISNRYDLIERHVRSYSKIAVSIDGRYEYAIDGEDYLNMTYDALDNISTVDFNWERIRDNLNGTVTAYARHTYYDESRSAKVLYLSYELDKIDGNYIITEVDSSLWRLY